VLLFVLDIPGSFFCEWKYMVEMNEVMRNKTLFSRVLFPLSLDRSVS
jgi:hypothetical protein